MRNPKTKELKTEIKILHQIIEIVSASRDLNDLVQRIAKVISENLKGDSCLVYLLDHSSHDLILSGAWPPHPYQIGKLRLESGEGITGWVADHRKPIALSRNASRDPRFKLFQNLPEDHYESFLSVPILLDDETIGVINVQNRKPRNFSASLIQLLNSVANQVAGVIEKTRLHEAARTKAKQIETIAKLSSSIVSDAYLQEILQLIVTMTAQMMNSKICSLMLLDDKSQELRIAATQSLSDEYRKKPALKLGQSISGKALQQKSAVVIDDVTSEPGYVYPEIAQREGLCSMIAVPMLIKDKPIGVINCYTTTQHRFTQEEISILQTIANQSAVAIENTHLLEESRTAREALQTRKLVERAKGVLMRDRKLGEEDAFQFMQKQSMNFRRTMREIAEAILLTDGLKNK